MLRIFNRVTQTSRLTTHNGVHCYPQYGYWGTPTSYISKLSKKCWAPGYGYINADSSKNDAPLLDSTIPGLFDFFIKLYFAVINRQISCLSLSCITPSFVKDWHITIPYLMSIFLYFYYKYALLWSLAHIYSRLLFFSLTRLRFFLVLSHFVCESLNKCCKIQ